MFTVQNAWTWDVWGCTQREAWFWALVNEASGGFVYNIYGPCGTHHMSADEVAAYV